MSEYQTEGRRSKNMNDRQVKTLSEAVRYRESLKRPSEKHKRGQRKRMKLMRTIRPVERPYVFLSKEGGSSIRRRAKFPASVDIEEMSLTGALMRLR